MKRYIILGRAASQRRDKTASADLGDNYATACKEFNSRGSVSKDWIWYPPTAEDKTAVWCQFRKNQCVAIYYETSRADSYIIDSEVWRLLLANSRGVTWTEYYVDPTNGSHSYLSKDEVMVATLTQGKQRLLIAYKTWFDRHHMWKNDEQSPSSKPASQ